MATRYLRVGIAVLGTALLLLTFTGCTGERPSFSAQVTMVPSLTPVTTLPKPESVECDDGPCAIKTRRALNDEREFVTPEPFPEKESRFSPDTVYDEEVAFAVRLVLSYNATAGVFKGTVANITGDMLPRVRVEVRLDGSNDRIADATLADLAPSQIVEVSIPAGSEPFAYWEVDTEIERIHLLD